MGGLCSFEIRSTYCTQLTCHRHSISPTSNSYFNQRPLALARSNLANLIQALVLLSHCRGENEAINWALSYYLDRAKEATAILRLNFESLFGLKGYVRSMSRTWGWRSMRRVFDPSLSWRSRSIRSTRGWRLIGFLERDAEDDTSNVGIDETR